MIEKVTVQLKNSSSVPISSAQNDAVSAQNRPSIFAHGQVDEEEDVQLQEAGHYEEDAVHEETGEADLDVELEVIERHHQVKSKDAENDGDVAVGQGSGNYLDWLVAQQDFYRPGQTKAQKDVQGVGAVCVAHSDVPVTCNAFLDFMICTVK